MTPAAWVVVLLAWQDLPRADARSHGLSGLAWDGKALIAVRDHPSALVEYVPDASYRSFTARRVWPLPLRDTEAVAVVDDGFLVADEEDAAIYHVDRRGRLGRKIAVPAPFEHPVDNLGFEGLGTSPDRRYLFFTTEAPLPDDGDSLRLERRDLRTGRTIERRYHLDPPPNGGLLGASELTPLSSHEVLVTERAYTPGAGNRVRIYHVDVDRPGSKELFVDFAGLPLANYEGVALGPKLRDGRRLLFVVADDNASDEQDARLLVLTFCQRDAPGCQRFAPASSP